jgi:hypothetical protein
MLLNCASCNHADYAIMLGAVILSAFILSGVLLSVVILSVVASILHSAQWSVLYTFLYS